VVASDTIGDAIRWCQDEKKKPVVVSFGNTSASGGYFISTHAKAIVAQRKTHSVSGYGFGAFLQKA
jgi:protease-4